MRRRGRGGARQSYCVSRARRQRLGVEAGSELRSRPLGMFEVFEAFLMFINDLPMMLQLPVEAFS
jgi:hypothetical protein